MGRAGERLDSDDELAAAAREGDGSALESLLLRHEGPVLSLLRRLGVPPADREDVAQEIFIRLIRNIERYRPALPFRGWLYRITVNACHDYRKREIRRGGERGASQQALEERSDRSPGPAELAEGAESARRLEQALDELSERERAVFVLCDMEEIPTREVAKALRISSITVRRHLGRARRRLQEILSSR